MKASDNPVVGRWRIVEADLWDREYLDLCSPAILRGSGQRRWRDRLRGHAGQPRFDYGPDEIGFTWVGFEMTEVSGAGSAELQDDGSLQIGFEYHLGDDAVLRAVRGPSSTAC